MKKLLNRWILVGLILPASLTCFSNYAYAKGVNDSPDPFQIYGKCYEGAVFRSKHQVLIEAGKTWKDVLAIKVLSCEAFIGGGGSTVVPCPRGTPAYYAYCVSNPNDGAGNFFVHGIVERNTITDPNASYTGCPGGATVQSKLPLVENFGIDPRLINGIVTLRCAAANGPAGTKRVPCPPSSPFSLCLRNQDDGLGNSVMLGVIAANGAGDPYGLYGNCTSGGEGTPGFRAKADILTDLGIPLDNIRSVDLTVCVNQSSAGIPTIPEVVSCSVLGFSNNEYTKCSWGSDSNRNYYGVGIEGGEQGPQ